MEKTRNTISTQIRMRRRMPRVPREIAALARKAREAGAKADPLAWWIVAELARRGWVIRAESAQTPKSTYFALLEGDPSAATEIARLFRGKSMSPHEIWAIVNSDAAA
jgi:hypothetical protein